MTCPCHFQINLENVPRRISSQRTEKYKQRTRSEINSKFQHTHEMANDSREQLIDCVCILCVSVESVNFQPPLVTETQSEQVPTSFLVYFHYKYTISNDSDNSKVLHCSYMFLLFVYYRVQEAMNLLKAGDCQQKNRWMQ